MRTFLLGLERVLRRTESAMLVGLLAAMIGVATYQIVARNLFATGFIWGDEMVRVAVLWVTMIGAMAAAGSDDHIRIDFITRFVDRRAALNFKRVTNLFTALCCFALGWCSLTLIVWDFLDQVVGFGVVPAWACQIVIPVAATVMGLRYLIAVVRPVSQ